MLLVIAAAACTTPWWNTKESDSDKDPFANAGDLLDQTSKNPISDSDSRRLSGSHFARGTCPMATTHYANEKWIFPYRQAFCPWNYRLTWKYRRTPACAGPVSDTVEFIDSNNH